MIEKEVLAKLVIKPCWGIYPLENLALRLVKKGNAFRVEGVIQAGRKRSCRVVKLSTPEVLDQLDKIKNATLPAFPISSMVMDGEYIELTIYGIRSDLTLSWRADGPKDADVLIDFASWLKIKGDVITP